jgi:hypothetical protein
MGRALPGLCAVLASLVAAACGSGSGAGLLTGKTPEQVVAAATTSASDAGSAHYVLFERVGSQSRTIVGDASVSEGRQVVTTGSQRIEVVFVGGVAYVQGNANGLAATLGFPTLLALAYAQRWIAVESSDSLYPAVVQAVTLDGALAELRPAGHLQFTGPAVVAGRQAIGVVGGIAGQAQGGTGGSSTVYVATSTPTLPLKFTAEAVRGSVHLTDVATFTKWGSAVQLSAPAGSVALSSIPLH